MFQEIRRALGRGSHLCCALRRVATLTRGGTKNGGWKTLGAEFRFGTCLFKCLQAEETLVDRLEIETNCDAGLGKQQRSDRRTC